MKEIQDIIDILLKKFETKSTPSQKVYTDEPIIRIAGQMKGYLPEEYKKMRALASSPNTYRNPPSWLFYQQGKLMEDFRDNFPYSERVVCYYPTYHQLSDSALRGYFTWRSKYRDGIVERTSTSFAYLYIYELLNLIGASSPEEGFQKLAQFKEQYAPLDESILKHLQTWMNDFVIYYGLDASLFQTTEPSDRVPQLLALHDYEDSSDEALFDAIAAFSSYNIANSKFYKEFPQDIQFVTITLFKELSRLYAKSRKNSYFTHLFGQYAPSYYPIFHSAMFYHQSKHPDTEFTVNPFHRYVCSNGIWSCQRFYTDGKNRELGDLLRYVDARLRTHYGYKAALKEPPVTKQVMKLVDAAIGALEAQKKQKEAVKIVIDVSKLQGIRAAADITREKLIVEEEMEETLPASAPSPSAEVLPLPGDSPHTPPSPPPQEVSLLPSPQAAPNDPSPSTAFGLTTGEAEILHALLMGEDGNSIARKNGLMLSIAVDSINEKLFDAFGDTVIVFEGDSPVVLEDYADDLKGLMEQ